MMKCQTVNVTCQPSIICQNSKQQSTRHAIRVLIFRGFIILKFMNNGPKEKRERF